MMKFILSSFIIRNPILLMSTFLVGVISLGTVDLFSNTGNKALVVYKKGNAYYMRNQKKKTITVHTILTENDTIITSRNSYVNLQLSGGVLLRIGEQTRITIKKILRNGDSENYHLQISEGEVISKAETKKKKLKLDIQSPTAIASVRGTEFFVEARKDSSKIAVNEGKVVVSSVDGTQNQTVKAGEKIIATFEKLKKSILETYEKQKFEMIRQLEETKKKNFENLLKQIERNQKLIEEQKNKIQFPDNPFKK